MKRLILAALLLPMMAGCGTLGFNDYEQYARAHVDHSASEARRVAAQAGAITDALMAAHPKTDTEAALMSVFAMLAIERIQPTQLNIQKPTTGFDVLNNLTGQATAIFGFGALGYLGSKAIESVGEVNFNGSNNSYSPFESHVTGSSQASTSIPYQSPTTTTTVPVLP